MNRVRVGIIGTGSIFYGWGGGSGQLQAHKHVRDSQVVALCDTDQSRLDRAAATLKTEYEKEARQAEIAGDTGRAHDLRQDAKDLKTYQDADEMLQQAGLDLVDIITPPRTHAPLSIRALRSGVNTLCAKPMTRNWLECLPVLEAVEQTGKLFGCAENMLYESPWYDTRKLVDSGAVGEPLLLSISFGIKDVLPIRWDPEMSGGGALIDMGIHALVTSWFILGFHCNPVWAKAVDPVGIAIRMPERLVAGRFERVEVEDDAHVLFGFEDPGTGARTQVFTESSWSGQDRPGTFLTGSTGELRIGSPIKVIDAWGNARDEGTRQPVSGYGIAEGKEPWYNGFVGMVREICRCVQDGTKPVYDVVRASEAMAVIGAAYLSEMRGRKAVSLDEFKDYALKLKETEGDDASGVFIQRLTEHLKSKVS